MSATSTSFAITVQWGMVPCIDRNGEITGYSVRYSGGCSTQTMNVTERETTLQDLTSSTNYSIEVAAVNSAGVGVYSYPIIIERTTKSKPNSIKLFYLLHKNYIYIHTFIHKCFLYYLCIVPAPGQPSVSVTAATATSISLSWSVPSGSVVTSSEVMWREASSGTSEGTSGSLTDTSYTIDQLESNTIYTITVTVSNTAGSTDSHPITSKGQHVA